MTLGKTCRVCLSVCVCVSGRPDVSGLHRTVEWKVLLTLWHWVKLVVCVCLSVCLCVCVIISNCECELYIVSSSFVICLWKKGWICYIIVVQTCIAMLEDWATQFQSHEMCFISLYVYYSLLGRHFLSYSYAKIHIPIIASVSEHQPTTWTSFFFDLHVLICVFPSGIWFVMKYLTDERVFG